MSKTKREIQYIYGEKTVPLNIRVPESKKDEIDSWIKEKLKEYINPKTIEIEVVSKRVRNIEVVDPEIVHNTDKLVVQVDYDITDGTPKEISRKEQNCEKKSTAKQSNDSTECVPEDYYEFRVIDSIPAKATEVKKGVSNLRELDGKYFTQIYTNKEWIYRVYNDLTKAKLYIANNFKK